MWVVLYLVGSGVHLAWAFCFPVQKGHHGTTVCGLEDGCFIASLSTYQLLLNLLKSTRQYGFPPQQFNDGSGSGMSNRWWQVMFTAHFCLWVWLVANIKDPWSVLQPSGYWKIVQYSFCKYPLEIVVVLSICILLNLSFAFWILFCGPVLWVLYCVVVCRDQILYFVAHHAMSTTWGLVYILLY